MIAGTSPNSHHYEHPESSVATKESFASGPGIMPPLVWIPNSTIDEREVCDSRMLLDDLGVHERRKHDLDIVRRPGP